MRARQFDDLDIYKAAFRPMRNTLAGRDEKMMMKLVVDADDARRASAPMCSARTPARWRSCSASPLKAGLTKDDFDRTMARASDRGGGAGDACTSRATGS